jgi:uncharacterized protein (TIGR02996 family)
MARNPLLEASINANPEDAQTYLVYADWLQQQGDPLGHQIVEHARGGGDYVREHETDMLGPLADYQDMLGRRTWQNGFLHTVSIANQFERSPMHDGKEPEFPVPELLAMVLDHESGRFLVDLTLGIVSYEENGYDECMQAIGARRVPSLRTLYVGDFHSEETELNWSNLGNAQPLYAGVPGLRSLTLRSGSMSLGHIDLPELHTFATLTRGLKKNAIETIVHAPWPKLERLELQLGSSRYDSDITPNDLQPILDGKLPAGVYHLGLANYSYAHELIDMLATSAILPRLRSLDLSLGTFNNDGAEQLIAHAKAFAHLEFIDLNESWLDHAMTARVRELVPNALVNEQRYDPRWPDDFYIAAGE